MKHPPKRRCFGVFIFNPSRKYLPIVCVFVSLFATRTTPRNSTACRLTNSIHWLLTPSCRPPLKAPPGTTPRNNTACCLAYSVTRQLCRADRSSRLNRSIILQFASLPKAFLSDSSSFSFLHCCSTQCNNFILSVMHLISGFGVIVLDFFIHLIFGIGVII